MTKPDERLQVTHVGTPLRTLEVRCSSLTLNEGILAVGALWPLTPSVDGAGRLVRAQLAIHHDAELVVLPSPDRVGQALIATEDSRFSWTPGIDPVSVLRMGLAAVTGSSDTGAATLEQQLAKNLYFPQDDAGVLSKVQEGELALKLDASYSKNEV